MEFVKGLSEDNLATSDSVWMGTDTRKIFMYAAAEPEKQDQISQTTVPAIITEIKYHCDCVFVALGNGNILIFHRDMSGAWSLKDPVTITLGTDPVSCLLPINMSVYAACGKKVWVINGLTGDIQKSFSVQHDHVGNVNLMAHSGVGLWISLKNSSTICLYHTETFKHLQDINLASNVLRVMGNCSRDCSTRTNRSTVTVSALLACRGLLWVGTTAGISLTIPLPRLEGVPIISGRVNISYHSHFGPITFLLALHPRTYNVNPYYNTQATKEIPTIVPKEVDTKDIEQTPEKVANEQEKSSETNEKKDSDRFKLEKQYSDTTMQNISAKLKHQLTSSPVVLRRRRSKDNEISRLSKTLPRGLGAGAGGALFCSTSQGSGDACDVYGLYGELMYVKDCEGEPGTLGEPNYETLRRSDPELAAIPAKVSTLDRKLRMKVSRPRSLDLSNWSVDSRSSSLYTSSGSEESMALRGGIGRSISRNNSNASRTIQLNNGNSDVVNITLNINNISNLNSNNLTNGNVLSVYPPSRSVSRSNSVAQEVIDKANSKNKKNAKTNNSLNDATKKTIITLMGGRGYVNWRQSCCLPEKPRTSMSPSSNKDLNKNDAHIVVWETKC